MEAGYRIYSLDNLIFFLTIIKTIQYCLMELSVIEELTKDI